MSNHNFLPYGRQCLEEEDWVAVREVLSSDWLTTGPAVGRFENTFSDIVGAAHTAVCSSGTAALHLATAALQLGPDDVVVVPSMTFLATANAVRFVGAQVRFSDVDPETGLMRVQDLAHAIEDLPRSQIRAAIPVHLNGQAADMDGLSQLATANGIDLIEDACHALGTATGSGNTKSLVGACRQSRMTVFSFHPVKTVAMGEGGAVTTNDADLAGRLRLLRNHGMTRDPSEFQQAAVDADGNPEPWHYEMTELGFNYRASDIHCALGSSQLTKLDKFCDRRRALARTYDKRLAALATVLKPVTKSPDCDPVLHLYAVLIDFDRAGISRAELMTRLRTRGVGTQVHYIPVHRQPYYRALYGDISLPGVERYYERVLSLPLFPAMDDDDVTRVVEALADCLGLPL